ncbi:dihydrolipoyl dehydrogenase [Acidimicrobiia bacterium]|nr:dihydrolipoyl dehydrogenase [Acidimicrobiaceae bacterium]MDA8653109.1 dihydrolipoyl dehydrogenase [Candidatus Actinomarina sp.]MDA8922905.1 dihydrolipoyl dehydrogenase [Acidimicrobiia bacterium]MDA7850730.1 dihydrolipoyl dehydrogenase [Acidimicrobiaceae bacterium]MDA8709961.1 dihydrolipoyl dehydrogenase [Candidatus Actinomarina sp.]
MKKLTIIGGGPAGYAAALYANNFDLEVTLVESDILGGTCLNRGCIPAKYWLHLAELNHEINNASDYGIQVETSEIDWNKSALKRQDIISGLVNGIGMLLKSKKVNVINGWGKIENEQSVLVKKEDGSEISIESDYILLATGSKPRELPSLQFDNEFIISSDSALNWEQPPKNVCIVGAGAIGCEFASALIDLGSNVTVVELEKEILPGLDKRTSGELRKQLTKRGVSFKMGTSIDSVADKEVLLSDGEKENFDTILVAIGRSPLTENIGLEDISVTTKNGYIDVNLETMQVIGTKNVFAAGDIISNSPQLAHVAFAEAMSAVTYIATGNPSPINYSAIPYVVYTNPELAEVGLNSDKAKLEEIDINQAQHSFAGIGRAMIQNQNQGLVKVYAQKDGPLVGASICGPSAGEMIHELMYMVGWEALPDEAAEFIHAHPTLSEAVGESLLSLNGKGLH